jgi:DNA-binding MarR family transcriptional regulator
VRAARRGRRGYPSRPPSSRSPNDLRSKRITLTARGKAAVKVIREAVAETEAAWAEQLGPKRFTQLHTLLHDLNWLT